MKLSCLPVSFFDEIITGRMTVGEWAEMGADIGLDGIDLSILFVPDRRLSTAAALRRDIERAGTTVTMVTTYPDFVHPEATQRLRELDLEREAVAIAKEIGAKYVRVTAGQAHPETGRESGVVWAVEGLTRLAEETKGSCVTLVYENHGKPGAWEYTDFSQPPDIFLEIAHAVEGVGLGINFDTANATAFAKNPLDLLSEVAPRVVTVHAADTAVKGKLEHVLLGTGITPFGEFFSMLRRTGWDGWICMEEASFQGRKGVERAASFIRKAWKDTTG
jgi:sugar phosphate isomerase/epimerase